MRRIKPLNNSGVTIIELLVAMTAFSVMILIIGLATMQLGKMYYKGISSAKTQEVSRDAMASIFEQAAFTTGNIDYATAKDYGPSSDRIAVQATCIGNTRYSYVLDRKQNSSLSSGHDSANKEIKHVLWQDTSDGNCEPVDLTQDAPSADGKELLGDNMRLSELLIDSPPTSPDIIKIGIGVFYGESDLIEYSGPTPESCKTGDISSQWCAFSKLSTRAYRRYPRTI